VAAPCPDGAMVKAIADELLLDKSAALPPHPGRGRGRLHRQRRGPPRPARRWRVADALPVATGLLPPGDQLQAALDDETAGHNDDDPSGLHGCRRATRVEEVTADDAWPWPILRRPAATQRGRPPRAPPRLDRRLGPGGQDGRLRPGQTPLPQVGEGAAAGRYETGRIRAKKRY
jgi:hypothetical protein